MTARELLRNELGNLEIDRLLTKVSDRDPEVVGEHGRKAILVECTKVDQNATQRPRAHGLELQCTKELPFVDQAFCKQALPEARW